MRTLFELPTHKYSRCCRCPKLHVGERFGRCAQYVVQESLSSRSLHTSARLNAVVDVLLAQTGEGIKECELIQWFVKVGVHVILCKQRYALPVQHAFGVLCVTWHAVGPVKALLSR